MVPVDDCGDLPCYLAEVCSQTATGKTMVQLGHRHWVNWLIYINQLSVIFITTVKDKTSLGPLGVLPITLLVQGLLRGVIISEAFVK